ncbi:hypothetical protein TNCV_487451 [Trichonephila clavipes]|nr:hypothetical protein TNCV_487451 [Trichonephila clavipes]
MTENWVASAKRLRGTIARLGSVMIVETDFHSTCIVPSLFHLVKRYWVLCTDPKQTALAHFRCDHLCRMTFVQGVKSFFAYPYFSCSSSGLLGHFPETVVWRSRSGL